MDPRTPGSSCTSSCPSQTRGATVGRSPVPSRRCRPAGAELPGAAADHRAARRDRGRDARPPGGHRRRRDRVGQEHPAAEAVPRSRARRDGLIGHTQPRRVAARTIAERVAEELGTELGSAVGYTVRFTDRVGADTRIKVMTDGILLAEIQRDRMLRRYDTIIIDEAHERSLNIDFLLGYLHRLLAERPDLHVVITSATIDTERFAEHFGGAPVIEVSGRTYPVEVRYRPFGTGEADGDGPVDDRDQVQAIGDAVDELAHVGPGDVLVFLSGEREIHDTAEHLRRLELPTPRCCRCTPGCRRPSSTASSSRTAGGGSCWRPTSPRRRSPCPACATWSTPAPRGSRATAPRLKVQRLPIEPVSQASANQRAGRCGRVAPGHLHPAVRRGGLRGPPGVHRARDPAHQPRLGHPADDRARPRRRRRVPVPRPARQPLDPRRRRPARGARRARARAWRPTGGG